MLWAVIAANILKYPFFEFGSRYANATGKSIIDGYLKLGRGVLWTYLIITIGSMFFVCAVVTVVTGGFMDNLFSITPKIANLGVPYPYLGSSVLVLVVCAGILFAGKYKLLDSMIKVIGAILLTFRERVGVKKQSYLKQILRNPSSAIELKEVESNKGVKIDD